MGGGAAEGLGMIGRLAGVLAWKGADQVLIDVYGVGYQVTVDARTAAALGAVGAEAVLWTELLVREDALTLVGFRTMAEREWHRLLMSVQGVGAKAALAILGTLGPDALGRAIALGDARQIQAAPGVGPKLAQRVVLELKGRAPALMALGAADVIEAPDTPPQPRKRGAAAAPPPVSANGQAQAEALSALANLGYSPAEAAQAVAEAAGTATDTPALIRAALQRLAPKG
jgi:holliday junction DNA helicase RuvA